MGWTEEKIDKLVGLWNEGNSAGVIEGKFNCEFSRSAIIGKINRLREAGVTLRSGGNSGGSSRSGGRPKKKSSGAKRSVGFKKATSTRRGSTGRSGTSNGRSKTPEHLKYKGPKAKGRVIGTPQYNSFLDVPDTAEEGRPHRFMCMVEVTTEDGEKTGICGNRAMFGTATDAHHVPRETRKRHCNSCFGQTRQIGTATIPKNMRERPALPPMQAPKQIALTPMSSNA